MKIKNLQQMKKALFGVISMKNLKVYFLFFLILSCSNRHTNLSLDGARYVIDLDGNKEAFLPYSSVFKNVRTIILETNTDCLIGRIDELQVLDGYLYILDKSAAKSLLVFDMEGRFIRKIGRMGQGPGEYFSLGDFTIDAENGFVFLLDFGLRIHKYRLDGKFIRTIEYQIPQSAINFIQFFNNRLYASVRPFEPTQDDFMLAEIDPDDGKILSQSLPLTYNKGWAETTSTGHSFFISRLNNPPRYTQLFMDYIVSLGKDIKPYIELKSNNLVTEKDFNNLSNEKIPTNTQFQVLQGASKIWDVNSFVENDEFILFRCKSGFMTGRRNSFSVLFQKETESVKIANRMSNDLVLRRIDNENQPGMSIFDGDFMFSDKNGAYEVVQTVFRLFEGFLSTIRNNEVVPELDRLDELLKLEDDANPVIFYYEFK